MSVQRSGDAFTSQKVTCPRVTGVLPASTVAVSVTTVSCFTADTGTPPEAIDSAVLVALCASAAGTRQRKTSVKEIGRRRMNLARKRRAKNNIHNGFSNGIMHYVSLILTFNKGPSTHPFRVYRELEPLEVSFGRVQFRKQPLVLLKRFRVNTPAACFYAHGMLQVQHLVVQQVLHRAARRIRAIEHAANHDGVVRRIVVAQHPPRMVRA